jgi:hypothetical protein
MILKVPGFLFYNAPFDNTKDFQPIPLTFPEEVRCRIIA